VLFRSQTDISFEGFDYKISISEKEGNVFRLKMDCSDITGSRVQTMDDVVILSNTMIIDVKRAIPGTKYPVTLIIEVENDGKSGYQGESQAQTG
jgi:hypothetical protein